MQNRPTIPKISYGNDRTALSGRLTGYGMHGRISLVSRPTRASISRALPTLVHFFPRFHLYFVRRVSHVQNIFLLPPRYEPDNLDFEKESSMARAGSERPLSYRHDPSNILISANNLSRRAQALSGFTEPLFLAKQPFGEKMNTRPCISPILPTAILQHVNRQSAYPRRYGIQAKQAGQVWGTDRKSEIRHIQFRFMHIQARSPDAPVVFRQPFLLHTRLFFKEPWTSTLAEKVSLPARRYKQKVALEKSDYENRLRSPIASAYGKKENAQMPGYWPQVMSLSPYPGILAYPQPGVRTAERGLAENGFRTSHDQPGQLLYPKAPHEQNIHALVSWTARIFPAPANAGFVRKDEHTRDYGPVHERLPALSVQIYPESRSKLSARISSACFAAAERIFPTSAALAVMHRHDSGPSFIFKQWQPTAAQWQPKSGIQPTIQSSGAWFITQERIFPTSTALAVTRRHDSGPSFIFKQWQPTAAQWRPKSGIQPAIQSSGAWFITQERIFPTSAALAVTHRYDAGQSFIFRQWQPTAAQWQPKSGIQPAIQSSGSYFTTTGKNFSHREPGFLSSTFRRLQQVKNLIHSRKGSYNYDQDRGKNDDYERDASLRFSGSNWSPWHSIVVHHIETANESPALVYKTTSLEKTIERNTVLRESDIVAKAPDKAEQIALSQRDAMSDQIKTHISSDKTSPFMDERQVSMITSQVYKRLERMLTMEKERRGGHR